MVFTDAILQPLHRHVADLERRVAAQSRVVDDLLARGDDPADATRTLLRFEAALRVTHAHLSIVLAARDRWYASDRACLDSAG